MGKNSQTKSVNPTNVQWSCQPFRGRGKKRIWHPSKCHRSTEWLTRFHHVVVFKTKVLHFKIENTPIKDTNGKRKFKRMLSFLFVNKQRFSLWHCLSRNLTLFSTRRIGALGWFWTNNAARLLKTLEVHSVLYDQRKVRFLKEIFVFIKVSWKTTKCAFEIVFSPCARPIYLAWTQRFSLSYANCFFGLTYGFLNKNFQKIKLFTCHCSFITLAQKTTIELEIARFWETFRRNLSWIKTEALFLYMFRIELLFIFSFITCHSRFCSV